MARKPFLTPEEAAALVAQHGSQRAAAAASGISQACINKHVKAAARRGFAPGTSFDLGGRVPPGYVIAGQSALAAADGTLRGRWDKTRQEGLADEDALHLPDPKKITKLSTMRDAEGRVIVQWTAEKPEDVAREAAWRAFAEELARDIPRVAPTPIPPAANDRLLAGYPVADHHLGMLSWKPESGASYDLKIAERLLVGAMSHLTQAARAAEHAFIAFLGDLMHYDSFETVTPTNRNMLDSDSRYPKVAWAAVRVMRTSIDLALQIHRTVHVVVVPGNHDPSSSVFLALCLHIAYENEPRVTIDASSQHYFYHRFGSVLLGAHHGHGTKMANLPLIMAADRPEDWGATRHRHWWTGHIHQSRVQPATSAQDYSGCYVESFRVLPPPDAWAAQKGYRPHRDMRSIIYHRDHGEVARHTVNPSMLELT